MRLSTPWMQTYSGVAFTPLDPRPEQVRLIDLAVSLAAQCRYNGHTRRHYSVAEHSVLLSKAVPAAVAPFALIHDCAEAYVGDLPPSIKGAIGPAYKQIEARVHRAVAAFFGLPHTIPTIVKAYDARILHNERAALLGPSPYDWDSDDDPLPGVVIHGWPSAEARTQFLRRVAELFPRLADEARTIAAQLAALEG